MKLPVNKRPSICVSPCPDHPRMAYSSPWDHFSTTPSRVLCQSISGRFLTRTQNHRRSTGITGSITTRRGPPRLERRTTAVSRRGQRRLRLLGRLVGRRVTGTDPARLGVGLGAGPKKKYIRPFGGQKAPKMGGGKRISRPKKKQAEAPRWNGMNLEPVGEL